MLNNHTALVSKVVYYCWNNRFIDERNVKDSRNSFKVQEQWSFNEKSKRRVKASQVNVEMVAVFSTNDERKIRHPYAKNKMNKNVGSWTQNESYTKNKTLKWKLFRL